MAAGDYSTVLRRLKIVISKDSNVACVIEAVACCGALAKGVRQPFAGSARNLLPTLMEKFQVKDTGLTVAAVVALSNIHKCALHKQEQCRWGYEKAKMVLDVGSSR